MWILASWPTPSVSEGKVLTTGPGKSWHCMLIEGLECDGSVKMRKKSSQIWQAFCIHFDSQQWVLKSLNLFRIKDSGEVTHITGDTSNLHTCSFVRKPLMQWSPLYSLEHEFITRKLVPKCKIQYIKFHQADQRERQKVDLILHLAIRAPIHSPLFTQKPAGKQKWQVKLYSPDEFFRATLNIGAFKMRNDYIWLVLKESHHRTGPHLGARHKWTGLSTWTPDIQSPKCIGAEVGDRYSQK